MPKNDQSSNRAEKPSSQRSHILTWLLFPLALFPLMALLSYDWHAIPELCTPTSSSSNWIGALGDNFAYYGYKLFGISIWIVPIVCVIAAICAIHGSRKMRPVRRISAFVGFLIFLSGLIQAISAHTPVISRMIAGVNTADAGGAIGYLMMTRCLSPLLSDFGAAILMVILVSTTLVAAIGVRNFTDCISAIFKWMIGTNREGAKSDSTDEFAAQSDAENGISHEQASYLAAIRAKEEVKRQRMEEKAAAKAEKLRIKEERRQLKKAANPEPSVSTPTPTPIVPVKKGQYVLPPLSLLNPLKTSHADHGDVDEMSARLIDTLKIFGIDAKLDYTVKGPVVTKYAIELAPGTRYSTVTNITDNLKGALRAKSIRIEAPIPGEDRIGIEVPNRSSAGISFREIIESDAWRNFKGELPLLFGKDAAGKELVADLAKMPHMLVAGATGQGKSVCLNAIINGLLMTKTPEELKLIMVDPKSVEFTSYSSIPHLIVPIITENRKVVYSLRWAVAEMEKRLKLFQRAKVRNIYDFNHRLQFTQTDMFGQDTEVGSGIPKSVPYIVIIIDEVADLMASNSKEVSPDIARLTAKARAAGIHLILATQRPDAKVITGTIKANIPGRVAFKTATAIDSRTILDDSGAENLIGKGDMLFRTAEGLLVRAQGAWISDPEIANIINFISEHSDTEFDETFATKLSHVKDAGIADPFADNQDDPDNQQNDSQSREEARAQVKAEAAADDFKKAVECIINTHRASTSYFQRQFSWGYNHAAKVLDLLEARGIVGPQSGMGARQIIMSQEQLLEIFNTPNGATSESDVPETDANMTEDASAEENTKEYDDALTLEG